MAVSGGKGLSSTAGGRGETDTVIAARVEERRRLSATLWAEVARCSHANHADFMHAPYAGKVCGHCEALKKIALPLSDEPWPPKAWVEASQAEMDASGDPAFLRGDGPWEVREGLPTCHACGHESEDVHVVHADDWLVDCVRCGHAGGVCLGEPHGPARWPRPRVAERPGET